MTDVPPPPPPPANYGGAGQPAMSNPLVGYWKRVVLEKYADFTGRARRAEYWWFTLANLIAFIVLFILLAIAKIFVVLLVIYWIALIVPSIAVTVRRLHDTDKAWYFILFGLVPFVGGLIVLVFMVLDSTSGANQWGVSEKYP
jgi:uncharacterized membrane protein YhaH (DUF805 family)